MTTAVIPGWQQRLAMCLFTKETAYDAATTINATNACEMYGFDSQVPAPGESDELVDDGGDLIQNSEFPTSQEILRQGFGMSYSEPRVKPNTLAGLGNLVLGARSSAQDAALAAYRHILTPVSWPTQLPSMNLIAKGGTQWLFKGVIGKSLTLDFKDDGFVGLNVELLGSGSRATDAAAFPAKITESWIKTTQCKVWLENGASIAIDATPVQEVESISSGTPVDLKLRFRKGQFKWDNDPFTNYGYGSAVRQEALQGAMRKASFGFSMLYVDDTELNHYLNQTTLAIELDAAGAVIAGGGTFKYGCQLIIPAMKLKKVGKAGKAGEFFTQDYEATLINDGSNPLARLVVYTAKAAYLA